MPCLLFLDKNRGNVLSDINFSSSSSLWCFFFNIFLQESKTQESPQFSPEFLDKEM